MRGSLRQLELIVYACFIQGVSFCFQPLPNGILTDRVWTNGMAGISYLATSLLLFLLTVFILVCLFRTTHLAVPSYHFQLYSSLQLFGRAILPTLGIRLFFDGINFLLTWLLPSYAALFLLFTEAACLCLVFAVVGAVMHYEKQPFGPRRRAALIGGIALLAGIAVWYVVRFFSDYNLRVYSAAKYTAYDLAYETTTDSFRLQLLMLVFMSLLWSLLSFRYTFFSVERKKHDKNKPYGTVFLARILALLLGMPFLAMGKVLALPHGTISRIQRPYSTVTHMSGEKHFNATDESWIITRKVSYSSSKIVLDETKVRIIYGNDCLLTFAPAFGNRDLWKETSIPDLKEDRITKVYRYGFNAIAYLSDEKPVVWNIHQINKHTQQDENLIAIMEYLVEDGYFEAFEYSYQYLLRYDPAFILPYMEKYAKGELTAAEQEKNSYLNQDYMLNFAKKIYIQRKE